MQVWFCRPCRLAFDDTGSPLVENPQILRTHFDALRIARNSVKTPEDVAHPVRLSMEAHMIQGLQEAYMSGLRDGLLLALNLDYEEDQFTK